LQRLNIHHIEGGTYESKRSKAQLTQYKFYGTVAVEVFS
jgi:hypothetical protein